MARKKKHPKEMTTDEAAKHLFGAKTVKRLKKELAKLEHHPNTKKV